MQQHVHDEHGQLWANSSGSSSRFISSSSSGANWFNTETIGGRTALSTDSAGTGDSGNLQPYVVTNYAIKS